MDQNWTSLLVKAAATVLVIMSASFVAERSGPFWGGVVAGLPVVAGPFYVLLALQADAAFIARSALSSFAAISAIGVFLLVLIRLAPRWRLGSALGMSIGAWFAAAAVLLRYPLSAVPATLVNLVVLVVCLRLTRDAWPAGVVVTAMPRRWFDVPFRALIIGGFVVGALAASRGIGQVEAGISTMFPLSLASLFILVHGRLGGVPAAATMASALRAMVGLGAALLVLHLSVSSWGAAPALLAALAASLTWSSALIAWSLRRRAMSGSTAAAARLPQSAVSRS
jgi:hypothetical protein